MEVESGVGGSILKLKKCKESAASASDLGVLVI